MGALRERLQWDGAQGAWHDGPRRYLMMRPDVLMGALALLDAPAQRAWLDAQAASARRHGADSLRAYAAQAPGDGAALIAATVAAAADLGWGRWQIETDAGSGLSLRVHASPFAAGWRAAAQGRAAQGVCAPIAGLFAALASLVLGTEVLAQECECAAAGADICHLLAIGRA